MNYNEKTPIDSKWFLWIMLIIVPPFGIALLWWRHLDDIPVTRRYTLTGIFFLWFLVLVSLSGAARETLDMTAHYPTTTIEEITTSL